jgi:hypothetical protein
MLEGIELSPAELQIGRRLQSSLPTSSALLEPTFVNGKKVNKTVMQNATKSGILFQQT